MAAQNNEDEDLTVSAVYETLRSQKFLNDLYWDAISNIKDKPTFKRMRETTEKIIKKKMDIIEKVPDMPDNSKRGIIAEICSMTYAIDAVFSKILYIKLDKYFKEKISGIIQELKSEGKLPDEISSKIQIPSNVNEYSKIINAKDTAQQKETEKIYQHEKKKENDTACDSNNLGYQKSITENTKTYLIRKKLSKKDIEDSIKASKAANKRNVPSPVASSSKKQLADKSASVTSALAASTSKLKNKEDEDSDAESEISVGHLSIASVSSVHTSDLSSFDDEISIGSEDEGGTKKRLSLKYLQQLCENGTPKLEKITNGLKVKESQKEIKKPPTRKTTGKKEIQASPAKSTNTHESTSSKLSTSTPSKRIRKPNSKYASDNIVCHSVKVKERKKTDVSFKSTNEKDSSKESPLKDRKRLRSGAEIGSPNKMQKLDSAEKGKNEKSASNKNETSSLSKSQSPLHSLTSRKSAPLTLFSTS